MVVGAHLRMREVVRRQRAHDPRRMLRGVMSVMQQQVSCSPKVPGTARQQPEVMKPGLTASSHACILPFVSRSLGLQYFCVFCRCTLPSVSRSVPRDAFSFFVDFEHLSRTAYYEILNSLLWTIVITAYYEQLIMKISIEPRTI